MFTDAVNFSPSPTVLVSPNNLSTLDVGNFDGGVPLYAFAGNVTPFDRPPMATTITAAVIGWNAEAEPGVGAAFFKNIIPTAPGVGLVSAIGGANVIDITLGSSFTQGDFHIGGLFLEGGEPFPNQAVTATAAALSFSPHHVGSQVLTEDGTALFAQVLGQGAGTAGHFQQDSPMGDALAVSGRLMLNRSYKVSIPRGADEFVVSDRFVTDRTVAIVNFTSDPGRSDVKMVTPVPGSSVIVTLDSKAHAPISASVALIN